jgi:hypothetical protein
LHLKRPTAAAISVSSSDSPSDPYFLKNGRAAFTRGQARKNAGDQVQYDPANCAYQHRASPFQNNASKKQETDATEHR